MHHNNLNLLPFKATSLIHSPANFRNVESVQGFSVRDYTSGNRSGVVAGHESVLRRTHRGWGGGGAAR